jgi:hypothetical protein
LDGVQRRVREFLVNPTEWLPVRKVAGWYADEWAAAKRRRAELDTLAPLGLTFADLRAGKHGLSDEVLKALLQLLVGWSLPDEHRGLTECIIAGTDLDGAMPGSYMSHLYHAWNGDVMCADSTGFAAVGAGARHASSHFMQAAYHISASFEEAMWLTYSAKRRAEVAPGVGAGTDVALISGLGQHIELAPEIIADLDRMFKNVRQREARSRRTDTERVTRWLAQLTPTTPPINPDSQEPPATTDGTEGSIGVSTLA